jgi:hypothetical protein
MSHEGQSHVRILLLLTFLFFGARGHVNADTNGVIPSGWSEVGTSLAADTNGLTDIIISTNGWDRWHSRWSSNVVGAANYIDRFFGDQRMEDEGNDTRIKLSLGVRFKEEDSPDVITRANIRLRLPRTSKKLQLVFEDLVESDDPASANDVLNDIGNSGPDAAVRYNLRKKKRVQLDVDVGARLSSTPQTYIRFRGTRAYELTRKWQLRLTQKMTWFTRDGWVSLSEVQWNKRMGWDWLLRINSELEWQEDRDGVRPAQQISVFKTFSRRRAIRFDVGGSWPEYPNIVERIYYTAVTHRRLLHSNWLYFEIKPGVEFPEIDDYDSQFFIKVQLDIILGKVN